MKNRRNVNQPKGEVSICLGIVCLLLFVSAPAMAWPWSQNRYDREGLKNGRWRTYHDENKKVVHYKGRYHHGKEVGTWKTYTPEGSLYFREQIKRRKKEIKTVYFHPNGKVSHRGMAVQERTPQGRLQYYWQGTWQYYDANGKPTGQKTFLKGEDLAGSNRPPIIYDSSDGADR